MEVEASLGDCSGTNLRRVGVAPTAGLVRWRLRHHLPTAGCRRTVASASRRRAYGIGILLVQSWHGQSCPCFGLDTTVQATLCLGETPKPRALVKCQHYPAGLLQPER
ncbi:MAG: hypothetical protein NZ874_02540 [Fimbriimonadales bacterium]|nr:hypothetical protein [Fimbriimonadales bacterium]